AAAPAAAVPQEVQPATTPFALDGNVQDEQAFPTGLPRRPVSRGLRSSLFIALVFIPLVSYAILATIAIIILYSRPAPVHPLEALPDVEGDFKGAKHQKQAPLSYERISPETELPAQLKVKLGQSLQLGNLDVRPEQVELLPIKIRHPGFEPEEQDQ